MVITTAEPPRKHPARDHAADGHARSEPTAARRRANERGQATVEFVAVLPILGLVALALGQAAVAGWTVWSAAGAARVAARAQALGTDPGDAARRVLPGMLARRAHVTVGGEDRDDLGQRATVRLHVPSLLPGLRFGTVESATELPNQQAGA